MTGIFILFHCSLCYSQGSLNTFFTINLVIEFSTVFTGHGGGFQSAVSCFPGFHPAIEACSLTWGNIEISSDAEKPQEPSITSGIFYQGANNAVCTSSSYDMVHSEGELAKSTEIKLDQDHDV